MAPITVASNLTTASMAIWYQQLCFFNMIRCVQNTYIKETTQLGFEVWLGKFENISKHLRKTWTKKDSILEYEHTTGHVSIDVMVKYSES